MLTLNPKKYKENIPAIAEANNLDDICTRDIVDFYWKQVRQATADLASPRIQIAELGYFQIYKTRLRRRINDCTKFFSMPPDRMTFQKHAVIATMERMLNQANRMQGWLDEETEKLKIIKDIKYGRIVIENMEGPKKDIRRRLEQLLQEAKDRKNSSKENGDLPQVSSD